MGGGGGYYRNSSYGFQRDGFVEESPGPQQRQHMNHGRFSSAPSYYGYPAEGPSPVQQQSYDAMTSGSDENSKSTNPSSQNSSFDHLHQMHMRKPDEYPQEMPSEYDAQFAPLNAPQPLGGMYNGPQYPNGHGNSNDVYDRNGNYNYQPQQQSSPMAPPKNATPNNPRVPIKLNTGAGGPPEDEFDFSGPSPGGRRKSWLKRAFSKRGS